MRNEIIDFHIHSMLSDGCLSRSELIDKVHQQSISAIAFTDHDILSKEHYQNDDIDIIAGIELSIHAEKGELHLLGYGFDYESKTIIDLTADEAFGTVLKNTVSTEKVKIHEGICAIKEGKGLSVLAHPVSLKMTHEQFIDYLANLKKIGLAGIEVYHPLHSEQDIAFFNECARKFDLLVTGGSDFHDQDKDVLGYYGKHRILEKNMFLQFLDRINNTTFRKNS